MEEADLLKTEVKKPLYDFQDCKLQLLGDFPNIYALHIQNILLFHKGHYVQAYMSLSDIMDDIYRQCPRFEKKQDPKPILSVIMSVTNDSGETEVFKLQNLACTRSQKTTNPVFLPLKEEIQIMKDEMKANKEEIDRKFAMNLLEVDYQEMGQLIECACCFGKCVFDNMAQCMEGHLVCVDCLNDFTKESVYGAGKTVLGCLASDCTAVYSEGELKRCLTAATWGKFEERALKENLNMAEFEDLVRCPYCDFAAILSPSIKMFHCFKDDCKKETCRDCGTDWVDHKGLLCKEVETKDETSLRKEFEEKMTKAKVRTCKRCEAEFTKESGCNKMTCRCGMTMCYICRTPEITYGHFCGHPRDPGKPCTVCASCSLWTNPEMDEERAIEEIRRDAQAKRKALGFEDEKLTAAPIALKLSKTKKKK